MHDIKRIAFLTGMTIERINELGGLQEQMLSANKKSENRGGDKRYV